MTCMAAGDGTVPRGYWVLFSDFSIKVQLSTPSAKSCLFAPL